ncbi:hypothetical protein K438DRAFT_1995068 [Mycena galopus ATCC 62051]|nr:hypothetical protein K438DRAFT_1995068 [Mycena galopus ATCC 62051]
MTCWRASHLAFRAPICWDMISASLNICSWLPLAQIAFQPQNTLGFAVAFVCRQPRTHGCIRISQRRRDAQGELRRQPLRLQHRHPPPPRHDHGAWLHRECAVFRTASPRLRALLSRDSSFLSPTLRDPVYHPHHSEGHSWTAGAARDNPHFLVPHTPSECRLWRPPVSELLAQPAPSTSQLQGRSSLLLCGVVSSLRMGKRCKNHPLIVIPWHLTTISTSVRLQAPGPLGVRCGALSTSRTWRGDTEIADSWTSDASSH